MDTGMLAASAMTLPALPALPFDQSHWELTPSRHSQHAVISTQESKIRSYRVRSQSDHAINHQLSPATTDNTWGGASAEPSCLCLEKQTKPVSSRINTPPPIQPALVAATSELIPQPPPPVRPPEDPFKNPKEIPGTVPTILAYPHSSAQISPAFKRRYQEVAEMFKQTVERNARLMDQVRHIGYELRLCGTCQQDAHPSILVFCRTAEFRALRSLLLETRLRRQYALCKTSPLMTWMTRIGGLPAPPADDYKPLFKLYFFRDQTPWVFLWGSIDGININKSEEGGDGDDGNSSMTLCGQGITVGGNPARRATISCVIQVGRSYYALTTAHTIESKDLSEGIPAPPYVQITESVDSQLLSALDDSDSEDSFMNDCEYEDLTDGSESDHDERRWMLKDGVEKEVLPFASPNISISNTKTVPSPPLNVLLSAQFPTMRENIINDQMDLDWALIELADSQDWKPNVLSIPEGDIGDKAFIFDTCADLVEIETPVYVIISPERTINGMLQPSLSLKHGTRGTRMSEYWTINVGDGISEYSSSVSSPKRRGQPHIYTGLMPGNSGSLVIDAVTHSIYGFVVAANPLGEIHISPFGAVMEQVKTYFPGSVVRLPPPSSVVEDTTSLHQRQTDNVAVTHKRHYLKETYMDRIYGWSISDIPSVHELRENCKNRRFPRLQQDASESNQFQSSRLAHNAQLEREPSFAFITIWEHCILPFLVEVIPIWCGPYYILSVVRSDESGLRCINITARRRISITRRLIIAAHVKHLLGKSGQTVVFRFSQGQMYRPIPKRPTDQHADAPRDAGRSVEKVHVSHRKSSTRGPIICVGQDRYCLVSTSSLGEPPETIDSSTIQHQSLETFGGGHRFAFKNQSSENSYRASLVSTRVSCEPYWWDYDQHPPLVVMDWALIREQTSHTANVWRRAPQEFGEELMVAKTGHVKPGASVLAFSQPAGSHARTICDVPAFISAAETGTGKATREWFVEESQGSSSGYSEAGESVICSRTGELVGQFWGCMKPIAEHHARLTFFTPIIDILRDIQSRLGTVFLLGLPQSQPTPSHIPELSPRSDFSRTDRTESVPRDNLLHWEADRATVSPVYGVQSSFNMMDRGAQTLYSESSGPVHSLFPSAFPTDFYHSSFPSMVPTDAYPTSFPSMVSAAAPFSSFPSIVQTAPYSIVPSTPYVPSSPKPGSAQATFDEFNKVYGGRSSKR